jgi:flagellar FliL protein
MADIPTLEPAQDVPLADEEAPAAPARSSKLLIMIAVSALVVAGAAVAGWHYLAASHKAAQKSAQASSESGPALYVSLDPAFVTNFEADQAVRFLQISVEVMTHDAATADLIKSTDPAVRNDLLLLFGNQKYADIATREGKERLRAAALTVLRKDVEANGGHPERVDAVYFTSFVMQ